MKASRQAELLVAFWLLAPFKACSCGATHTREQWAELPLVGHYEDAYELLELRNCHCKSTMAIAVDVRSANDTEPPPAADPAVAVVDDGDHIDARLRAGGTR